MMCQQAKPRRNGLQGTFSRTGTALVLAILVAEALCAGDAAARLPKAPGIAHTISNGRSGHTVLFRMFEGHPHAEWHDNRLFDDQVNGCRAEGQTRGLRWIMQHYRPTISRHRSVPPDPTFVPRLPAVAESIIRFEHNSELPPGPIVVLERSNPLRSIVSQRLVAARARELDDVKKNDPFHFRPEEPVPPAVVALPLDDLRFEGADGTLIQVLDQLTGIWTGLRRFAGTRPSLWLTYEQDVERDPRDGYQRICDFLGIRPQDNPVPLRRQNPERLDQLVTNIGEVRAALRNTPYAWMAEEGN